MTKQDEIQKVALNEAKNCKFDRFSMDIGTGVGKSLLIIKHMQSVFHEFSTFLITIPRTSMMLNWEIELKKFNAEHLLPHIHFSTYRSIHKLKKTFDWVYLDECHNFKSDLHYECIEKLSINTFAVTGTYVSDKDFNYSKFTLLFPKIFRYDTQKSVNEEMLNDYRIIIHMIPLSKEIRTNSYIHGFQPETQAYFSVNSAVTTAERNRRYNSLKQLRITRMKMLQGAMSKILYAKALAQHLNKKTLIFVESTEHADKVCNHSYHSKISKIKKEKNLEDFKKGIIQQLSCVGELNEGVNIPDLEESIIQHGYANNTRSKQRIGRLLRLGAETKRIAYIHMLCYKNTVDVNWIKDALADFDSSKIGIYSEEKTNQLLKLAKL